MSITNKRISTKQDDKLQKTLYNTGNKYFTGSIPVLVNIC